MNRKNKKARLEKLEKAYEKMPHGPLTLTFRKGLRDGIPICLGYLSVSFTFGMMVVENDLPAWIAMMISMTNLTSAGQFAGTELIIQGAMYVEVAITTFVINIRYMLMSLSLSQKVEERMTNWQRLVLSFGITDEVFAVAMQQKEAINSRYMSGLILTPYLGWSLGTLLGDTATGFLPLSVRTALGIAIYGMFLAIIVPPARHSKPILLVIGISVAISCCFAWIPFLNQLSSGWVIIICAVVASAFAAWKFPIKEDGS